MQCDSSPEKRFSEAIHQKSRADLWKKPSQSNALMSLAEQAEP